MKISEIISERLRRYDINPDSDCWEWNSTINNSSGYGVIVINVYAHRASYEEHVGPIPDGLVIDHLCRNRKCINPAHLEPVSFEENISRGHINRTAPYVNQNSRKTHCKNGHELNEENTYVVKQSGHRQCKLCRRKISKQFFKDNPSYKKEYWAENIEENRKKQREYLEKKKSSKK